MGINSIRHQRTKLNLSNRDFTKEDVMFTVESHEYNADTGIDSYVLNPGNMKAQVKVTEVDGEPQVLLGVDGMAVQTGVNEPTWTVCRNPEIVKIALADYEARK